MSNTDNDTVLVSRLTCKTYNGVHVAQLVVATDLGGSDRTGSEAYHEMLVAAAYRKLREEHPAHYYFNNRSFAKVIPQGAVTKLDARLITDQGVAKALDSYDAEKREDGGDSILRTSDIHLAIVLGEHTNDFCTKLGYKGFPREALLPAVRAWRASKEA